MSKITQEKKALKGKQKKIAESKEAKKASENSETSSKKSSVLNEGKCCSCAHYPQHVRGEAQPCKIKKAYVARKCDACASYKCKFN